jgi:hypothetical protein
MVLLRGLGEGIAIAAETDDLVASYSLRPSSHWLGPGRAGSQPSRHISTTVGYLTDGPSLRRLDEFRSSANNHHRAAGMSRDVLAHGPQEEPGETAMTA